MAERVAEHLIISLFVFLIVHKLDAVNPLVNSSITVQTLEGSGGGSGQITSSAEVTDIPFLSATIEDSVVQEELTNTAIVSSTEELFNIFLNVSERDEKSSSVDNLSVPNENSSENYFKNTAHRNLNENNVQLNPNLDFDIEETKKIDRNISNFKDQGSTTGKEHISVTGYNSSLFDEEDIFKQPFDEDSFNFLINDDSALNQNETIGLNNNEENTERRSRKLSNVSVSDPLLIDQIQSDSPNIESNAESPETTESFETVFNISARNNDSVNEKNYFNFEQADQPIDQTSYDNLGYLPKQIDNIFEVYHLSRKPDANFSNAANKSLADHIEEIILSRLPTYNVNNQQSHTTESPLEEDDISDIEPLYIRRGDIDPATEYDYGDEETEDGDDEVKEETQIGTTTPPEKGNTEDTNKAVETVEEEEEDDGGYEEKPQGASLAIVFDTTGSMHDDLVQVRIGAEKIMAAMLERPDKPIYNYVLVPFHDPKIGPVTVTTDHKVFREGLQRIVVWGGGDCPEMAVGAIKKAIEVSLPNSFIYVFTDARAKDFKLMNEVLSLIQRKQCRVVFVMTGDCGDNTHVGYKVFEKIATTSSGQIYSLNKTDVEKVLQYVRTTLQSRNVNLLSVNKPGPSKDKHNVFVDETLQEITVSVSGQNPQIDVVDPRGKPVNGSPQINTVLNLPNIKAVSIVAPEPGKWTVRVGSDSEHSVRSTGQSDIDFDFGFSKIPTHKMEETYHRPLKGDKNAILVQPSQKNIVYNLTTLKLIDLRGTEFQEYPLHTVPGKSDLFQGPMFVPPNDYFYLSVEGFDKDGFPIRRISQTAITGQNPEPPFVKMKPEVTGWLNKPVKLKCHIESLVPFTAMWFKNGVPLTSREQYQQTSELAWVVKNPTVGAEGNYTCYASNVAGSTTKGTWLTVTGPAPQVDTPAQVVSTPNGMAVLDCTVRSQLHYNITWARSSSNSSVLPDHNNIERIQSNGKWTIMPNGTLIINTVVVDDAGWYLCIAHNKGGQGEGPVYLTVKESIHVAVAPEKFEFQQGNQISLTCQATGIPEPKLTWKKNGKVLKEGSERKLQLRQYHRRLDLFMENADISDAGEYHCVAENDNDVVGLPVVLNCTATGSPTPIIRWSNKQNEILTNSKYQIQQDGSFIINNAQVTDSGEYICVAENKLGASNDLILLEVGTPPQMVHIPKDAGKEEAGYYICNVKNMFGEVHYEVQVNITGIGNSILQNNYLNFFFYNHNIIIYSLFFSNALYSILFGDHEVVISAMFWYSTVFIITSYL
ncbi:hypothetical protein C0J52_19154 [Blattella germanica]|nr:hypothetical protein C0J52_19154 [Blattella germanica]